MKVNVVTIVVAAIVALVIGFAAGYKSAESSVRTEMQADVNEVRFARSIGAITNTVTTLGLIEQRQGAAIQQLQEKTLTQYARDAKETVIFARHIGERAASVDQSLAMGMAYAQRHNMKEAFADLGATRQALKTIAGK